MTCRPKAASQRGPAWLESAGPVLFVSVCLCCHSANEIAHANQLKFLVRHPICIYSMISRAKGPMESFESLKVTGGVSTGCVEAMVSDTGIAAFSVRGCYFISAVCFELLKVSFSLSFHLEDTYFL